MCGAVSVLRSVRLGDVLTGLEVTVTSPHTSLKRLKTITTTNLQVNLVGCADIAIIENVAIYILMAKAKVTAWPWA